MPTTKVFGIYSTPGQVEAAVDRLVESGFVPGAISVLHPENENTRDFAHRKGTKAPASTTEGKTASVPLGGSLGLRDPGAGPVEGALPAALADMGVPAEWCDRRVVDDGKVLLSVECEQTEQVTRAIEILKGAGAEEVESAGFPTHEASRPSSEHSASGKEQHWPEIGSRNT